MMRRNRGDYTRVLFHFAHEAADALAHPAFRTPSPREGGTFTSHPGRNRVAGSQSCVRCLTIESGGVWRRTLRPSQIVITGLVPVIHVFRRGAWLDVDGRVEPGRDKPAAESDATGSVSYDVVPANAGTHNHRAV